MSGWAWLAIGVVVSMGPGWVEPPTARAVEAVDFEGKIAPLLVRHCLDCHGGESPKGGLNLSTRESLLAGGKAGGAFVPGSLEESLAWRHVEAGRMPPKSRPRLGEEEKQQLRGWIAAGLPWSGGPLRGVDRGELSAASAWVRRLTTSEYIETVRATLGVEIEREARELLPRDLRADGFQNTAYNLNVDFAHVEAYARLAETITARLNLPPFLARFSGSTEATPENLRATISALGLPLLRGPLEPRERESFERLARAVVEEGGDFHDAMRFVLEAMLQSPRFLYRMEGERRGVVGDYEIASRLSYIAWGAPPDDELLRAAAAGELRAPEKLAAQTRRLLEHPRAVEQSGRFLHEWMNLDRLASLRPSPKHFPQWNERLAEDMRLETRAFFEEVAWRQGRPLHELFNAQFTFATPRLAAHYGLDSALAVSEENGARRTGPGRIEEGLLALYTFEEGAGELVRDAAPGSEPLDLKIENMAAVRREPGKLMVENPTRLSSNGPARKLTESLRGGGEISLEAWLEPADARQQGPARVLTLSRDTNQRNFTLGQEGDKFEARLRTTKTSTNGMPGIQSRGGSAGAALTHVVFTRERSGKTRLYVNGGEQAAGNAAGDFSNWDANFQLAIGNELSGDRPWRGTLHLIALYGRSLGEEEVRRNFEAGPAGAASGLIRYDLSSLPPRGGLLTQGSVLTIGGDEGSMVTRGLFVLGELLYSGVEDPPPCVDTTPVPAKPGLSQRAISEQRLANKACTACHAKFETIAFGLERFDGAGAYREIDRHGNPLRDDGEILFPEAESPTPFRSSAELMELLAGSDRVRMGITRKLTQFSLGRPLTEADEPALAKVHRRAQAAGGTYPALLEAVLLSDLVLPTSTEPQP